LTWKTEVPGEKLFPMALCSPEISPEWQRDWIRPFQQEAGN